MRYAAECPSCQHEFETTIARAQEGLRCFKCDTAFTPETLKQYDDVPKPFPYIDPLPVEKKPTRKESDAEIEARQRRDRSDTLISTAETLWVFAVIFMAGAGISCIFALFGEPQVKYVGAACAGAFIFLAMCFTLFSHLNHIRALLERK